MRRTELRSALARLRRVLVHTGRGFSGNESAMRAAALAYYSLLSAFPLLLFLLYLAGQALQLQATQTTLIEAIQAALPQLAQPAAELIERTVDARASFGLVGAAGLLWTASGAFTVLASSFSRIWEAKPRPVWRRRFVGIVAVLTLALLFVTSIVTSALSAIDSAQVSSLSQQLVRLLAEFGLTTALVWLLYAWLPNRDVDLRAAGIGAITAAVLWQAAKLAFSAYLAVGWPRLGAVYGSLGSLVVLMLWVYVSSVILLLGAELAATIQLERRQSSNRIDN